MLASLEAPLYPIVSKFNTYLSSYILVFLLIAVGLWYSVKTNFVQVRCFGEGMKKVFGNMSLRGGKQTSGMTSFQALFVIVVVVGCVAPLSVVWDMADTFNGLMAIPNFIALFALSGVVAAETKKYFSNKENLK